MHTSHMPGRCHTATRGKNSYADVVQSRFVSFVSDKRREGKDKFLCSLLKNSLKKFGKYLAPRPNGTNGIQTIPHYLLR